MYTYLASPYSSRLETPELRWKQMEKRFYDVMHALAWMNAQKLWAYSPIVHCHEMASRYKLGTDNNYWKEFNRAFIRPAESVTILCLPGWRESEGVTDERQFTTEIGKPLHFLVPAILTDSNGEAVEIQYDVRTSEPLDA